MHILRNNLKYLLLFLAVYIFLFGTYYLLSVGLQPRTIGLSSRRFIPCALAVVLAIKIWLRCKQSLVSLKVPVTISVAWALIYPTCYWIAYHDSQSFIDKHFDHAFAAYSFACFITLSLLLKYFLSPKYACLLATIVQIGLLYIPLLQLQYFGLYQLPITEPGAVALLQTNFNEAKEYLLLNLGIAGIAINLFVSFILIYLLYTNNQTVFSINLNLSKHKLALVSVLFFATAIYSIKIFPSTGVLEAYCFAREYYQKSLIFKENHGKNFETLTVTPTTPAFSRPSTIIMVIGESASSHFMSSYNQTKNNTTPWLKEMIDNSKIYKIQHAYTSCCQTVPSLERALTQKNQYNNKEFFESISILDVAKKAGYTTYWFSNQGSISDVDTPITLVAQTANYSKWLIDTSAGSKKMLYDGDLLPLLKDINPNTNNFVVFHLMGSHEDTINRFPPEAARFEKPGKFNTLANYDDSLAYTDDILKTIFEYGTHNLNMQAFVYFSDHGSQPRIRRSPDPKGFIPTRIPFVIWLSEEYKSIYPETAATIKTAQNKYFTNDLTFDAMCSLFQVKTNAYNEDESILSPEYKYDKDNLTTYLGKIKISEDTNK